MIRVLTLGSLLCLAASLAGCGTPSTVKCTMANCSGCCTENDECLSATKQSRQACGPAGGACRVCLPSQLCSAGQCLRDPDASVLLDDAGNPIDPTDAGSDAGQVQCGARGQACCGVAQTCFISLTCQRGVCDVPASGGGGGAGGGTGGGSGGGTGGGAGGAGGGGTGGGSGGGAGGGTGGGGGAATKVTGDACALDRECIDGACLVFGFNGGYCTKACNTSADCVAGSQCGVNPSGVGPAKVCLKQCSSPGQAPGGCRTSYVCEANAGTSGVPVCFPACASSTTCGLAPTCDSRGFCCGTNGFVCCEGTTCESGNTCMSGTCRSGGTGGGTGGGGAGGGAGGGTGGGGAGGGAGGGTGGGASGGGAGGGTGGGGAGAMAPVGSPCVNWLTDCDGNACFAEASSPQWVGGYCTNAFCTASSCGAGNSCSPYVVSGENYCLKNCTWDGGRGDCRTGYVCDRYLINGTDQATCVAACTSNTQCGTGRCSNGFCCGNRYFRTCATSPACNTGQGTATNGYCL